MAVYRNFALGRVALAASLLACCTGPNTQLTAQVSRQVSAVTTPTIGNGAPLMPAGYYGMHVLHLPYGTAWPATKFGTWRLWDAGVDWKQLEPAAGVYNWTTLDTYMALAKQKQIDVLLELGQTPQWASARPNDTGQGAIAEPSNDQYWIDYVTAVVTRYKGQIKYYEVWNEASSATYWDGTPAKLVQLTAEAYKVIKTIDPNATVVSPSLPTVDTPRIAWENSLFAAGMGNYVDAIGVHLYALGKTPEAVLTEAQSLQALMKTYSLSSKPILCTEFGWANPNTFASQDEQSGWYIRSTLMGWTAGVQRFIWYAWDNSNWVTLTMTMPDFVTPTKPSIAMATLEGWTINHEVAPCVNNSNTWSCDITDQAGDHSRIYWNTTGSATVNLQLNWRPSATIDMYGNKTPFSGLTLKVTDLPVLLIE
jgi:hypothetical protein